MSSVIIPAACGPRFLYQRARPRSFEVVRDYVQETIAEVVARGRWGWYLPALIFIEGAEERFFLPVFDFPNWSEDGYELTELVWTLANKHFAPVAAIAVPHEGLERLVATLTGFRATGIHLGVMDGDGTSELFCADIIRRRDDLVLSPWRREERGDV